MAERFTRRDFLKKGALFGVGTIFTPEIISVFSEEKSYAVTSQQFFPETNFYVRDQEAPFLSGFREFGGLETFGYPISRAWESQGKRYQAFQRAILRWEKDHLSLAPVMDWLHENGKDGWLEDFGIPPALEGDFPFKERLSWLTEERIREVYFQNPGKVTGWEGTDFYGLPTSLPKNTGPFVVQRFKNYAFQLWQEDFAGLPKKGSVVGILSGEYAKRAGLIPQEVLVTEEAPAPIEERPLRPAPNPPIKETPRQQETAGSKEAEYRGGVLFRGPSVPQVAITIDDGWWPSQIEKQVEIAQKYGIKLTFFLVGRVLKMPAWEKSITKALEAGCELQNHTFNHVWLTKCSSEEIAWEIKAAKEVIFDLTKGEGNSGRYLRPPFGAYDGRVVSIAHSLGLEVAMWSNGSGGTSRDKDGNLISAGACFNNLVATTGWGSIPLVHTNWNDTGALDPYVSWIKEKGMSPVLLSELVPPRDLV